MGAEKTMNRIINFSLNNKFAVWLLTIIVMAAGLYSGMTMKLETIPNINTPVISVVTVYPGATPEEVADKVTIPIEKATKNLNGVDIVTSTSFQNASSVQITYDYEKNMDEAKKELEEALSAIQFPEGVDKPKISKISFNSIPVIALSISEKNASLADLTKTVEEEIVPSIERINGVSSVQISGQQIEEVQIAFDEKKLAQFGLNKETVQNLIKASDVSFPLGLYTFNDKEESVVVDGDITSIEELKALEIPIIPQAPNPQNGMNGNVSGTDLQGNHSIPNTSHSAMTPNTNSINQPGTNNPTQNKGNIPSDPSNNTTGLKNVVPGLPTVKLGEIADIQVVEKAESISRTNGKEAIGLQVVKADDANTVTVVNEIKKELKKFTEKYDGLEIITGFDMATPIEESIKTMIDKALFGALFAAIIILLFLRNIRSTLIAVISIPLSVLIALLVLKQLDITLNMMTLGAMTVAIGRVIDDSIVVIENIFRRLHLKEEKLKGKQLIREATKEMFIPIMSSTIVTIVVFLPLALVKGMVGELFLPFALTIVFALLASLLVAITIVPLMGHSLFQKELKGQNEHKKEKQWKLAGYYKKILNWSLNHKIVTSFIAVALLVASVFLVPLIGVSFLPSDAEKMMVITYKPDPGETLEQVKEYTFKAEEYFLNKKEVETVQLSIGSENPMNPGDTNSAIIFVAYDDDTPDFQKEKEQVIKDLQEMVKQGKWAQQDFSSGAGSNQLVYYVYGENREELEPVVNKIQDLMKKEKDLTKIDSSISETYDEYTLVADHEKLSKLGLTAAQIGLELMPTRQNPVVTTIEKNGKELNVYSTFAPKK